MSEKLARSSTSTSSARQLRRNRLVSTIAAIVAGFFVFSNAAAAMSPDAAKRDIQNTIMRFFAVAATGGQDAWQTVITQDFQAFEDGNAMDRTAIVSGIRAAQAAGVQFVWRPAPATIDVHGDLAVAHWLNTGSVTRNGVTTPVTWLEMAEVRRFPEGWRLSFLSSQRKKPAA